ncbi:MULTISPECIES: hypothetical protein [Xanthomonas]|uniref:Uncharacterized protein n=1 Tax=Xanthomonas cucurbitae TaxID=56453 RepID=A0A2S7DRX9_9XANT|nr:hypothetical protein [Xanthomonas cucurbitae]PPU76592.1 hypothetical protein XcuCFBP2542_09145 [Xanthomonas cucurbitae]QHG88874.1 hypothetical protein EBN15_19940 [Xanthomonas cucurbitae]WDM67761.1 hypothetical protein K6981_20430 [Xanthomonas cucurbitae]WDM71636.1 hypothetical protein K6978_20390 [Xanthomonas cucurbitae]WDM75479.1 hypothetical protein K6982_19525 [Xanthomonas cucurbitae]
MADSREKGMCDVRTQYAPAKDLLHAADVEMRRGRPQTAATTQVCAAACAKQLILNVFFKSAKRSALAMWRGLNLCTPRQGAATVCPSAFGHLAPMRQARRPRMLYITMENTVNGSPFRHRGASMTGKDWA